MERTHARGIVDEMAGGAQALAGDVLGDAEMQVAGRVKALYGKSHRLASNAADATRGTIVDNPLAALGVAAGIGLVCGALWVWKRE
ncbi:CsbD family protein [Paraburkholderia sp. A1RI-2L]|uniref:CsbD family protein n=1 Tax=Paraburkholderia sp. A1RI-2L TaxID=3028367 RepID=UPI003B7EA577